MFSITVEDSARGRLSAMRYTSATAKVWTRGACRVQLLLTIAGVPDTAELLSTSRWIAPTPMAATPGTCEEDHQETVDRIQLTIAPPAQP